LRFFQTFHIPTDLRPLEENCLSPHRRRKRDFFSRERRPAGYVKGLLRPTGSRDIRKHHVARVWPLLRVSLLWMGTLTANSLDLRGSLDFSGTGADGNPIFLSEGPQLCGVSAFCPTHTGRGGAWPPLPARGVP